MEFPRVALIPYLLAGLAAALLSLPASAGIKCWTNDDGVRECGDAIPPEYAQKAYSEINKGGITVSTTERAKTKEELRIERQENARLAAIREEEARKIRERKAKDRVLLSTFTTEKELAVAHEGQVAAIELRIEHTERILVQLERSLEQLRSQAATLERRGKPITPELERKIAIAEQRMQNNYSLIEQRRTQKAELVAQFAKDRDRYRKLKGIK